MQKNNIKKYAGIGLLVTALSLGGFVIRDQNIEKNEDRVISYVKPIEIINEIGETKYYLPEGYSLGIDENNDLVGMKYVSSDEYGIIKPIKVENSNGTVEYYLPDGFELSQDENGNSIGVRTDLEIKR